MAKILKPMRLDEELIDIIEKRKGNNFTQKCEEMLWHCIKTEKERLAEIDRLDRVIENKKLEINDLNSNIGELENAVRVFHEFSKCMLDGNIYGLKKCIEKLKKISKL